MHMKKKTLGSILTAALLAGLAGCSNGGPEPTSEPSAQPSAGSAAGTIEAQAAPPAGDADSNRLGLPNERRVEDGKVIAGGQPSADTLRRAKAQGVTVVVNLRTPGEPGQDFEEGLLRELGIRYERIPVAGGAGMTEENARKLGEILSSAEGPVVVHCASGNRVGGLYALKRFLVDGVPRAQALEEGRAAGMRSVASAVEAFMNQYCEAHPDHGGC